jgi:hypothetical protein
MDNLFLLLFLVSFISLIVGLIKPTAFSRFIKGNVTRKKIATIFGIATIAFFFLFGMTTETSHNNQVLEQPKTENSEIVVDSESTDPSPAVVDITPTPTQVKQIDNTNVPLVTSETVSQKNAVKKAKSYLAYTAFSHDGLVAQLEYEQFSHLDAVYGVDNSGGNWNEQAAKKAQSYMDYSAFSRGSLIDQLKYDKFTQEQAEYGANSVGL